MLLRARALACLCGGFLLMLAGSGRAVAKDASVPPNVVYIMADDVGWET